MRIRKLQPGRSESPSGAEIARLILRGALGGTLIAHGVRHGRTLDGTARCFESLGFREPKLQARMSSVVEVGSGAAVVLGAGTPLAASAVAGTMSVAYRTVHRPNGYFVIASAPDGSASTGCSGSTEPATAPPAQP